MASPGVGGVVVGAGGVRNAIPGLPAHGPPPRGAADATSPPAGARTPGVAPLRRSAAAIRAHSVREPAPSGVSVAASSCEGCFGNTLRGEVGACVCQKQRRVSGIHRSTKIKKS